MVLKYGTACDSRMTEVLSTQPESLPDVETIHKRLPSMRATRLTMLIPTVELTFEVSAEWWTSPMPFSMTIRWPTQLDSVCPTMSNGESSPATASRKRWNRTRRILMPGPRIELGWGRPHLVLSTGRLPVPPPGRAVQVYGNNDVITC